MLTHVKRILAIWCCSLIAAGCREPAKPVRKPAPKPVPRRTLCKPMPAQRFHVKLTPGRFDPLKRSNYKPAYAERMRRNNRTSGRQRYKTAIYGGVKAEKARFHLAVLLWRTAMNDEAALGEAPGKKAPHTRILDYRKRQDRIKNYRREALFHLEYLVKRKKPSLPMLERYAYYTAHMNPRKAVPIFYRLLENTRTRFRRYYNLDFASLLVATNRCSEAELIASKPWPATQKIARTKLLMGLALCDARALSAITPKKIKKLCSVAPKGYFQQIVPFLAKLSLLLPLSKSSCRPEELPQLCPRLRTKEASKHFNFVVSTLTKRWGLGSARAPYLGKRPTGWQNKLFWAEWGRHHSPLLSKIKWLSGGSGSLVLTITPKGVPEIPKGIPQESALGEGLRSIHFPHTGKCPPPVRQVHLHF